MEEQNEKIEKSANDSLNEFVGKPVEQASSVEVPSPVEQVQPTTTPDQPQFSGEVKQEVKPMIDPSKIIIGKAVDGDGTKNKLDADDWEEVKHGDKTIKVSKKEYIIEKVDKQDDLVVKKIVAGDIKYSRDRTNSWYQTRFEIYYKDSKYKSSLPNIKWFKDRYNENLYNPSFKTISTEKEYQSNFSPQVSKLYYKFCQQFNKIAGDFGQEEFENALIGKKVKLVEVSEEFENKTYFRLDIFQFV